MTKSSFHLKNGSIHLYLQVSIFQIANHIPFYTTKCTNTQLSFINQINKGNRLMSAFSSLCRLNGNIGARIMIQNVYGPVIY